MQIRIITVCAVFILTAVLLNFVAHSEKITPNKSFDSFPLSIGDWKGVRGALDQEVYNVLGVEDYIIANYSLPDSKMINLYIGFYQSQKEGDIIHSPKNCMPGSGWNITNTSKEKIEMDNGTSFETIKLYLQKGSETQIVLYWFQSRGRIISSEYMQKIWLVIDSITRHRTDGSFVRIISPIIENEEQTVKTLKAFAKSVYPHLLEYIPS